MTDISGINGVSDDSTRHYTPTTEEVRDSYASWSDAYPEFDRWLIQERQRVAEMAIKKEHDRIINILNSEIERVSNPMLVDREYLDGLEEAIALIKGETE